MDSCLRPAPGHTAVLRVLALGTPVVVPPSPGEVYGLHLADGGTLPAVVLHVYERGLFQDARVLWVLDRRQHERDIDVASLCSAPPLLPPLILHREVWTLGCAFRLGQLATDSPLLHKRVVITNNVTRRTHDLAEQPVDAPGQQDVVAKDNLVFLRGLDDRLHRSASLSRVS